MVDKQHDAQRQESQISIREGASNEVIGVVLCEVLGREAMDCLRGSGAKVHIGAGKPLRTTQHQIRATGSKY